MQSSGTLLDYLTIADIVVFLGLPLCLLTIVLAQHLLAGKTIPPSVAHTRVDRHRLLMKELETRAKRLPGGTAPGK